MAEVCLTGELFVETNLGETAACRLLGDLAHRSQEFEEEPGKSGTLLVIGEASAGRARPSQQVEIYFSSLKQFSVWARI